MSSCASSSQDAFDAAHGIMCPTPYLAVVCVSHMEGVCQREGRLTKSFAALRATPFSAKIVPNNAPSSQPVSLPELTALIFDGVLVALAHPYANKALVSEAARIFCFVLHFFPLFLFFFSLFFFLFPFVFVAGSNFLPISFMRGNYTNMKYMPFW